MPANQEHENAYVSNEVSANKHMTSVLLFTASLLLLVLVGYLTKFFGVSHDTFVLTVIVIPIVALALCTPMLFIKSERIKRPGYKIYLLILFVLAIGTLNAIMPKHASLGWAVCIALTGHYYSTKTCRIMFIAVLVMMAVCITLGTFIGEFDSHLLSGDLDEDTQLIHNYLLPNTYPDTISGRATYMHDLAAAGDNRYVKIYGTYYLGRALFVTLLYVVMLFLNKRTHTLLNSEISINTAFQKNKTELEVAKDIQLNTLPSESVSSKDAEILAELKAAKEVGGDLYDYVSIDEDHVALLIGDVSGKGVPAAMFMMKTITSFRDFATAGKKPSEIIKAINASVMKGNKASMFVTCFLAILNKKDGTMVYANAGHNPPLVGANKDYHYLKCNSGLFLGCFPNCFVKDEEISLKPGESVLFYTDGVTEARNGSGELFGEKRLLEVMNKQDYTSLVELHHSIKNEIASFVGDAPQSDDITIMTLKYRGGQYSYKEQEFDAKKDNIPAMLGLIQDFGKEHDFPTSFTNQLTVVGDELISNIINHGYGETKGEIFLRLLLNHEENEFILTVIDEAKPFNQLAVVNPLAGTEQGLATIGGLGIHIVKKIMTECSYDRVNGKNILVLKKRF